MTDNAASDWEEIHGFVSPGEFERFLTWVDEAIAEGVLIPVPPKERFSGSPIFEERRFRRTGTSETWRVLAPDPPFRGVFEKVDGWERRSLIATS